MDSPFKEKNRIFKDKQPFDDEYTPEQILERDEEIEQYGNALQDVIDGFGPPNVFVYGQTGVGKTAVTKKMKDFLMKDADSAKVDLTIIDINCNKRPTTYQIVMTLANELHPDKTINQGYHPTQLWNLIYDQMDDIGGDFLVILDEIDKLGEDETLLYEFPRARDMGDLEEARVGVVGISNNFKFREQLSGRVKSTLCEREIHFSPYDATELQTILDYYTELTFRDDVISENVVSLCSAFTAQDTGDARKALDLLETAGDIARHEGDDVVTEEHVHMAQPEVDRANTREIVRDRLTMQMQVVLLAVTFLEIDQHAEAKIKNVYAVYKDIAEKINVNTLSESRIRDHVNSLEMFGLLEYTEKNLGQRGGRAYIYNVAGDPRPIIETFESIDRFSDAVPATVQTRLSKYEENTTTDFQKEIQ